MTQGKRGQVLEQMVEYSNASYKQKGMAIVDKVPTPWNVSYNKRTGKVISAFPQKKGTVDFVGVSHGRSIAFDAKNTKNKTSFPLSNIEDHQVEYLLNHENHGGYSFMIVCFESHNEYYYLPIYDLNAWWVAQAKGGRKSIPYAWFTMNCSKIRSKDGIMLDYLSNCDTDYKKVKGMKKHDIKTNRS